MAIRITEVRTGAEITRFIRLPWKIYRGDGNWVPPLLAERRAFIDPHRNPFFEHSDVGLFLASDETGGEVGRIAAIVNHNHVKTHNERVGFFGLFESVNRPDVAKALLDAAAVRLRSQGMEIMRGPENMSVNDDVGLLVKGFDSPPTFMMPYNPPYYETLLEACGGMGIMDIYAYTGETDGTIPDRLQRTVDMLRKRHQFTVRTIDLKHFQTELKRIRQIYNEAWEKNWGAVAMTDREFDYLAKDLKSVLDPGFCLIAEAGGKAVGFSLALRDYNQALIRMNGRLFPFGFLKLLYYRRRIDAVRIITLGVLPEYRRMGIDAAFIYETYKHGISKGIYRGEMSWVLAVNTPMNNLLARLGYERAKTYRLYDYRL